MDDQTRSILREAQQEIISLRRYAEVASAKLEVFYLCAGMVNAQPPQQISRGQGEDVAWKIDRHVQAHEDAQAAAAKDAAAREAIERVSGGKID